MKVSFWIGLMLISQVAFSAAQDDVLTIVARMPEFPGGTNALTQYIRDNISYPSEARENNYSGKAYVNFIVDTSGQVLSPKIIKSSGHKCLDDEALRVVRAMPKWTPGSDSVHKVKVSMNLPVGFKNLGVVSARTEESKLTPEQQVKHDNAMAQWNEGHKLERKQMFDKALERFNKSLDIEPDNKYALFDKGKMHMVLGEKDKACDIWNKMIQNNVRKDEAEEFVKKYCSSDNGVEQMVRDYNKIKAGDFFSAGIKDVETGRYEAALHKFDSCLKYRSEHKDALYNKAAMHLKLDQKNRACSTWNQLMILNKDDAEVQSLIKKHCN